MYVYAVCYDLFQKNSIETFRKISVHTLLISDNPFFTLAMDLQCSNTHVYIVSSSMSVYWGHFHSIGGLFCVLTDLCIVLWEDRFVKDENDVSPECFPPQKFQPAEEIRIDSHYLEYEAIVLCMLRDPDGKPRLVCIMYWLVVSHLRERFCLTNFFDQFPR